MADSRKNVPGSDVGASPPDAKRYLHLWTDIANESKTSESVSDERIKEAIGLIKTEFRSEGSPGLLGINFDVPANRCACLLTIAPLYTLLTKFTIGEFFQRARENIIDDLVSREKLTVVSLGGGPGSDSIGVCAGLAQQFFKPDIDVFVLDKWRGWKGILHDVVLYISKNHAKYLDMVVELKKATFEFEEVDLLEIAARGALTGGAKRIASADIILGMKFFSCFEQSQKIDMLKVILSEMRPGSILLYIDIQSEDLIHLAEQRKDLDIIMKRPRRKFTIPESCVNSTSVSTCVFDVCAVYKSDPEETKD